MPLTSIAFRRLHLDIKNLDKFRDEMSEEGVYTYVDDKDITEIYALIIGTEGTPYEGGFYFFHLKIPDNYPFAPPKVKFLTLSSDVRIHPNLYTEGKVCLSIINTWDGDGWSASQSVHTLLRSMQFYLFVKFPLHNEPGYEEESEDKGTTTHNFTKFVQYQNIRVAINKILQTLPPKLSPFKPVMENRIRKHSVKYFEHIRKLKEEYSYDIVLCTAYGNQSSCTCDYNLQYETFVKYCATLGISFEESASASASASASKTEEETTKEKMIVVTGGAGGSGVTKTAETKTAETVAIKKTTKMSSSKTFKKMKKDSKA